MLRTRPVAFMQFSDPRAYDVLALGRSPPRRALATGSRRRRLGYALRALKENEQPPRRWAWTPSARRFRLRPSAAPGRSRGVIYTHASCFIVTPEAVFGRAGIVQTSWFLLVGGVAASGPIIGSALMVPLSGCSTQRSATGYPAIQGVVYGGALVL